MVITNLLLVVLSMFSIKFIHGFNQIRVNSRRFTKTTSLFSDPVADQTAAAPISKTSSDLSCLEIRIGKIVELSKHPEAENLYVEKVDLGEMDGPRTIVSGLVQYCTEESLLNRNVIVLCNLKPRALKGRQSSYNNLIIYTTLTLNLYACI